MFPAASKHMQGRNLPWGSTWGFLQVPQLSLGTKWVPAPCAVLVKNAQPSLGMMLLLIFMLSSICYWKFSLSKVQLRTTVRCFPWVWSLSLLCRFTKGKKKSRKALRFYLISASTFWQPEFEKNYTGPRGKKSCCEDIKGWRAVISSNLCFHQEVPTVYIYKYMHIYIQIYTQAHVYVFIPSRKTACVFFKKTPASSIRWYILQHLNVLALQRHSSVANWAL